MNGLAFWQRSTKLCFYNLAFPLLDGKKIYISAKVFFLTDSSSFSLALKTILKSTPLFSAAPLRYSSFSSLDCFIPITGSALALPLKDVPFSRFF